MTDLLLYKLMIFLPLSGSIFGFISRKDRPAQLITTLLIITSAVISCSLLIQIKGDGPTILHLLDWIQVGEFRASWELRFDTLSAVMLVIVFGISSLVHMYSIGYMAHDKSIPRFMSYLSLFTFAMAMLVTSNNLLQLFFGWEGVGLCSYLLIGFWYNRDQANAAAMKAFIVNRIGDFGFVLGILGIFVTFGSIEFPQIFEKVLSLNGQGIPIDILCLLLFIGAMGKSAQLGLHTWLPDAMEGPTPVSALIHAATMVTAGIFMVARLSPLFEQAHLARDVVAVIGATTAVFASTIALTQNDIKRVVAYSTCAQLGLMFLACGLSAYNLAIFHLMTHAFFKSLLFLSAGSVIHAMSGEQDMQKMGGLWKHIPITYAVMWIGSLALAGVPYFAGYFSKDAILEVALGAATTPLGQYIYIMGLASVLLTALYSWRLLFMTFHGSPRANEHVMGHIHESPWIMLIPLLFLSGGAIFTGAFGMPYFMDPLFWGGALVTNPHPHLISHLPLFLSLGGIAIAYVLYIKIPSLPNQLASSCSKIYAFLLNKWYVDELYNILFVIPLEKLGNLFWVWGDQKTIDRFGPDGVASVGTRLSGWTRRIQTGLIYDYAVVMVGGLIILGGSVFILGQYMDDILMLISLSTSGAK